jgi:hypothetical protein
LAPQQPGERHQRSVTSGRCVRLLLPASRACAPQTGRVVAVVDVIGRVGWTSWGKSITHAVVRR